MWGEALVVFMPFMLDEMSCYMYSFRLGHDEYIGTRWMANIYGTPDQSLSSPMVAAGAIA